MNGADRIGMIGMGLLGTALVHRLQANGFQVSGYDCDPERRAGAAVMGVHIADSAASLVRGSTRIVLSLPNSDIVANVLLQSEEVLTPGTVFLDTTTGAPDRAVDFAKRLTRHKAAYLDTTIGGSSKQTHAGEAIILCGGGPAVFEKCEPLVRCFGRQTFYLGPAGSGSRMKLVLNLVLGLNRAVLAEGLAFAMASGVPADVALEVLRAGPAYSRVMDTKGEKMLTLDFIPEARLSQHLKDVRIILEEGRLRGAQLPFSLLHSEVLDQLERDGYGAEDNSAVIRAFLAQPQE